MRWSLCWLLVAGIGFSLGAPYGRADDAKEAAILKDRKRITGTWRITELESDGVRISESEARQHTLVNQEDGTWSLQLNGQEIVRGSSTFDPTKSPKEVDFAISDENGQTTNYHGIYELEQDQRRLCIAPSDYPRPTEFTSFSGTQRVLLTCERVKTE